MITNTGKTIIGKYLLGQAPAYASYIAIGCGATPLDTGDPLEDYSLKENLDFEMFRVPISSRGFVNENGVDKIVLTAELPAEERYEISEIGIYSAGSNPSAGAYDSKTVFAFTQTENWQYVTSSATSLIPTILVQLDTENDNIIPGSYLINPLTKEYDAVNGVLTATPVLQTNADNAIFFKTPRLESERPRFLNNTIMIEGNESDLDLESESGPTEGTFTIGAGSNYIRLNGPSVDFTRNSPRDELRLAFSIVNRDGNEEGIQPERARVLVSFENTDGTKYARLEAEVVDDSSGGEYDFATERYFVVKKQIQDLYKTSDFDWNAVSVVKIYACVLSDDSGPTAVPSSNYYVALDALRLENVATVNPLYGLTGYSVIETSGASTIIKNPNTSTYVEFRFSIGVQ
jgi:hypothetical protein